MGNNNNSKEIYTLGIWTVKPDKEKEFIEAWTEFAQWTDASVSGPGRAYLLQDETNKLRFISFGPWDNEQSIQAWRETESFKTFVEKVKGLCDDFQPNTLKVVSTSK
jgi:heme-degrading monooxygenase HmoA